MECKSLMGGLSESLLNHGPVKVFTYEFQIQIFTTANLQMNIERIKGIKLFRKYRKANLVNNFINENSNIRVCISRSLEKFRIVKQKNT